MHGVEALAVNLQQNQPQSPHVEEEHVFPGPIVDTPFAVEMHSVSCKENALMEVYISLSNEGVQSCVVSIFCHIGALTIVRAHHCTLEATALKSEWFKV